MAHFAELKVMTDPTGFTSDSHQVVQRVVVVANDEVPSDMHVDGETWCINFFKGGIWKQTSYNHNFRKQYAGIGYVYDETKDVFITSQPYASWTINNDNDWEAPITFPSIVDDGEETPEWTWRISWNEDLYQSDNSKGWVGVKSNDTGDPVTLYDWNGSAWISR